MRFALSVLLACLLGISAQIALAQPSATSGFIQPAQALIPVGQSQTFQLLNREGNEEPSLRWTLSNPDLAELKVDDGRAIVTVKAAGELTLSNSLAAEPAEIVVHNGEPPMPQDNRWILRPLNGGFVNALWASGTWGGSAEGADEETDSTPKYYYQDRGPDGSQIRAVRENGLQTWQWPVHRPAEALTMICGDIFGGVLLQIGDKKSRVLIDLDANGQERWRAPAPGFSGRDFTFTMSGIFLFVEDDPDGMGARIVGLDAKNGRQKFWQELPKSRQLLRNLSIREGKLICSPAAETLVPLPLRHSNMMSNVEGVANLAYSEFLLVAEGGKCSPGAIVEISNVSVSVTQKLMMMDIHDDLTQTTTSIEQNTVEGPAATTQVRASVPTGDIIVGEQGTGNFLAVRRTLQLWQPTGPGTIEEFQYRITENRTVKYRFPVSVTPPGLRSTMLLGEDNLGYTTRGRTVFAFNTETGAEIWRWTSLVSNVFACAALKNSEVMVYEGGRYAILKDGKPQEYRDDAFMLFVAKLRYDFDSF
jgi:hypothetical protein